MHMDTETKSPLTIRISQDHLSATIEVDDDAELSTVSANDIVAALQAVNVAVDDKVRPRVENYVGALRSPDGPPKGESEIASGRPPTEGEDGTFTWEESLDPQATEKDEDGAIDYYSLSAITTVESGTRIGSIAAPKPGVDGVDVRGSPLRAKTRPREVSLKNGVELGDDGVSVIATTEGRVVFENLELSIDEVVNISGDVDFETGNLDLASDAVVRGVVRDLFKVKTNKSLTVGGAVEAAEIQAEENVTVRGGILNRNKGKVVAGGEIVAKFCDEADLHAQGDIRISKSVMNSKVHTEGKLLAPQGSVIAGEVFARRGVEIATLGSDAEVPTLITVGLHKEEIRKIEETAKENEKRRASVEKIRQAVGPLMAQLKRLTGAQREKATELMFQADMIEGEIKESEEEVAVLRVTDGEENKPYVLVTSKIHQNVSVTINDRVVSFHEEVKGPIKIERRRMQNHSVVASVNQLTGSVCELPARKIEIEPQS